MLFFKVLLSLCLGSSSYVFCFICFPFSYLSEVLWLYLDLQGNMAQVVEKLQQLEINSNPAARNSVTGKDVKDASGANQLLVCLILRIAILV